ncbi:hypothetical protein KC338_g47 [Hortaea werneckii]|nr:hypothetical protein KC338_g47 [Hortaea werneckii]
MSLRCWPINRWFLSMTSDRSSKLRHALLASRRFLIWLDRMTGSFPSDGEYRFKMIDQFLYGAESLVYHSTRQLIVDQDLAPLQSIHEKRFVFSDIQSFSATRRASAGNRSDLIVLTAAFYLARSPRRTSMQCLPAFSEEHDLLLADMKVHRWRKGIAMQKAALTDLISIRLGVSGRNKRCHASLKAARPLLTKSSKSSLPQPLVVAIFAAKIVSCVNTAATKRYSFKCGSKTTRSVELSTNGVSSSSSSPIGAFVRFLFAAGRPRTVFSTTQSRSRVLQRLQRASPVPHASGDE